MEIKRESKSVAYIEEPKGFEMAPEVTVPFCPLLLISVASTAPAQHVPRLVPRGVRTLRVGRLPQRISSLETCLYSRSLSSL